MTNKKEKDNYSNSRPFYRREVIYTENGQESLKYNDNKNPWEERQTYADIFGSLSSEIKETVLHNKWWKSTENDTDEAHLWSSYQLEDSCYSARSEDDDHYDKIDESEMKTSNEVQKKDSKIVRSHPPVRPPHPLSLVPHPILNQDRLRLSMEIEPSGVVEDNRKAAASTVVNNVSKQEAMDRCFEYSEMVKIFRPLIIQNLLVHDILPYLPFLENHDDIYEDVKNHSPKNAVVSLLNELEKSKELGKWQKFIDALSTCGYTYIVDNIRGYRFICHDYQKEYIKKLTPKIGKMIDPVVLLHHLLAKDVISDSDKENIQREDNNHGNFAAAVLMLDRITRKHGNWYALFIEALTDANMEHVAADLQIPELLKNTRTKVTEISEAEYDVHYDLPPFPRPEEKNLETSKRNSEYGCNDDYSFSYHSESCDEEENLETLKRNSEYGFYDDECIIYHSDSCDDDDYEVYQDSLKPPLPPRIPIKKKRKVPLPDELYHSQNSDLYDENMVYEKYHCTEMYDTPLLTSNTEYVIEETGKKGKVIDDAVHKFKDLLDDFEKTKTINEDIRMENYLLEKKSAILKEVNSGLKRRLQLQGEIAVNEKEMKALQSGTCQEDENVSDDKSDEYYPTRTSTSHDVNTQVSTPGNNYQIKRTLDYRHLSEFGNHAFSRIPSFTIDSPLSTVPIYSPNFDRTSIVSHLFEEDSGIGLDFSFEFGSVK